jgi:hypothetical protein
VNPSNALNSRDAAFGLPTSDRRQPHGQHGDLTEYDGQSFPQEAESKMKFMVEFRFKPGGKNDVLDAFELRGPNHNPGVTFRGAWIGSRSEVAFVLVESSDESLIEKASQSWADHGEYRITPVVDVEQI